MFFLSRNSGPESEHLLHLLLILPPVFSRIEALPCISIPLFLSGLLYQVVFWNEMPLKRSLSKGDAALTTSRLGS